MANTKRDSGRETFWRRTLVKHEHSGLSIREFCRQQKLHESAFYFWRRTIRQRTAQPRGPKPPRPRPSRSRPPAFVPLVLGQAHAAANITLELRGGRSLQLNESFPMDRLAGLVLALEAAENRP